MPIDQQMWNITNGTTPVKETMLTNEQELEDILSNDISILNESWLIIGRQVMTSANKYIDLLAIDYTGSLIVIELKKNKTPRDVVAQAIDYASWVKSLTVDDITNIFHSYAKEYLQSNQILEEADYGTLKVPIKAK